MYVLKIKRIKSNDVELSQVSSTISQRGRGRAVFLRLVQLLKLLLEFFETALNFSFEC